MEFMSAREAADKWAFLKEVKPSIILMGDFMDSK